jgi:hypothetical protein
VTAALTSSSVFGSAPTEETEPSSVLESKESLQPEGLKFQSQSLESSFLTAAGTFLRSLQLLAGGTPWEWVARDNLSIANRVCRLIVGIGDFSYQNESHRICGSQIRNMLVQRANCLLWGFRAISIDRAHRLHRAFEQAFYDVDAECGTQVDFFSPMETHRLPSKSSRQQTPMSFHRGFQSCTISNLNISLK